MLALDWWFIKELQFFYCYSFELNSLTLCLLHCLVRQSVISETNQISRPLPFNAERTTNRETRDGEEFWVLCDCYLNADMECSVGACAAQLRSIGMVQNDSPVNEFISMKMMEIQVISYILIEWVCCLLCKTMHGIDCKNQWQMMMVSTLTNQIIVSEHATIDDG